MNLVRPHCLLLVSLALCLAPQLTAQSPADASSSAPTLAETTEWLSHNLPLLTSSYNVQFTRSAQKNKYAAKDWTEFLVESVTAAKFDGCTLSFTTESIDNNGSLYSKVTSIYHVPLESLTPVEILTTNRNNMDLKLYKATLSSTSYQSFKLTAARAVIAASYRSISRIGMDPETTSETTDERIPSVEIKGDDAALMPRVVKALNHAILLCRAAEKPEPF
jgi:hypothetical protein